MSTTTTLLLLVTITAIFSLVAGDWNILSPKWKNGVGINLKNYCESWRINVELNNIRDFDVVPDECVNYIGKYMTSTQYKADSERAVEECSIYLSNTFQLTGDGKDAWIFDIDDTLLSTRPYFKNHNYGGEILNKTSLEEWMRKGKAPVLDHTLRLYNEIKRRGLKIFLISSRGECLRDATVNNLVKEGYYSWTGLILRGAEDSNKGVQKYKTEQRKMLINNGYRIWGIVGDQWSSLLGLPNAKRTFKLPNSLYYDS
ncbi:acid phosphatase 1 [Magnolia sinica]|uniref:acid phosphatase 1 n=1 Tax=Magnolia sinica TaxID=86752 RepID=UPI0026589BB8|nr:acid phosphatase 1 [Magnolia sinica]